MKIIETNKQIPEEELQYLNNSSWSIYNLVDNKLEYHTNSYDYKYAYRNWYLTLKEQLLEYDSNMLLINDGDQVFYNAYKLPTTATIVDKNAYLLSEDKYKKYLNTTKFLNTVDSLGHVRKLTLIDTSFMESLQDGCFNTKYDLIFVNVKSKEDIDTPTLEKYFLLLNDYGFLCVQSNSTFFTDAIRSTLDHYFTNLSEKFKTTSISESHSFLVYRKMSNLI